MFDEKFGLSSSGPMGEGRGNSVRRTTSNLSFGTKKSSADDAEIVNNGRYSSTPILADDDSSIAEVLSPASTSGSHSNMFPPSSSSSSSANHNRSSGSISSLASLATTSKLPPSRPSSAARTNASMEDITSSSYQSRSRANTVTSSEGGGDSYARDFMYSNAATHPLPTSATPLDQSGSTATGRRSLPPASGTQVGKPKDTHWYETKVGYGGINLPIRIPLGTFPSEIGDVSTLSLSLSPLFLGRASSLTRFENRTSVFPDQPNPNLFLASFSRSFLSPTSFPSHLWSFYTSNHPPLQRPRHFSSSRFPRTRSSGRESSRSSSRCLCTRERLWSGVGWVRGTYIPLHEFE